MLSRLSGAPLPDAPSGVSLSRKLPADRHSPPATPAVTRQRVYTAFSTAEWRDHWRWARHVIIGYLALAALLMLIIGALAEQRPHPAGAAGATGAPAAEPDGAGKVLDQTLRDAAQRPEIIGALLLGAADIRENTARQELLAHIATWLAANIDLPALAEQPRIAYASPARMAELRHNGLTPAAYRDVTVGQPSAAARTTVAVYVDVERTIYLPQEWTGRTPAELSMLVHEMVHHLQNLGGIRHECPRGREKLAYAAQEKWLQLFGQTLQSEFELDPLTVLVSSMCGN
jgi:hypothetical protein